MPSDRSTWLPPLRAPGPAASKPPLRPHDDEQLWTAGFDDLAPFSELDGAPLVSGRLRGMRHRRRIAGAGVAVAFLAVAIGVTASARLTRNEVEAGSDAGR